MFLIIKNYIVKCLVNKAIEFFFLEFDETKQNKKQ